MLDLVGVLKTKVYVVGADARSSVEFCDSSFSRMQTRARRNSSSQILDQIGESLGVDFNMHWIIFVIASDLGTRACE
jgi:hypothetical protein